MFDESAVEFEKSLSLAVKKFRIMKTKVGEVQELMGEFKKSSGRLETLYMKDINQRR